MLLSPPTSALPELRPYQREIRAAVTESVRGGLGRTITVEIARQGGKNEVAAQIEWFLLSRYAERGGEIVKCAPSRDPQLSISMRRLWARLRASASGPLARVRGSTIEVGAARIHFLSAEPHANVAGHTASILLAADEAQDIDPDKFDRDFRPMAAAHNATTVMYGTTWDSRSLLERAKQGNLEGQRADGIKRHFAVGWETVAAHVPAYADYVESERNRLGERHALFLTQYCLEPVEGGGRLFSHADLRSLSGSHERLPCMLVGDRYVAGLDIAGGDDADASDARPSRGRDSTVLTIGRIILPPSDALIDEPRVEVVEHASWTGVPHERLIAQLIDALRNGWWVERIVIDATGIGETIARLIAAKIGFRKVVALKFTQELKSKLGFELLAATQTARLKIYRADGSSEYAECRRQLERARVDYRVNGTMNFYVDPSEGHDDYVTSLALLCHAARDRTRRPAIGRVRSDAL